MKREMKALENVTIRSAMSARNISSLSHISQYIYRVEYVLAFKRGCYWIMNVLKRPKFRMRGEHYFRQGSNNFVRFYITRPWTPESAPCSCIVFNVCYMLKCTYVRPP